MGRGVDVLRRAPNPITSQQRGGLQTLPSAPADCHANQGSPRDTPRQEELGET